MINLKLLNKCKSLYEPVNFFVEESLKLIIDTRKISGPCIFVAIPGEKVNPLEILLRSLHSSCKIVIYEKNATNDLLISTLKSHNPTVFFLPVSNSISFLQELSELHIKEWLSSNSKNIVFAISGSNGKTTHKEMLSFILNKIKPGKVVATEKNNNNHLGVPLTILEVNSQTEFLVLELGSNHPGEIKFLCEISHPNAGLTTNIGATHLEFFKNEEAVFREEGYLYEAVKQNTQGKGFFLINKDDPYLSSLEKTFGSVTFGLNAGVEAKIDLRDEIRLEYQNHILKVKNQHITGKHNKLNLITCCFIAFHFYPELQESIESVAREFKPTKNRSEWITFKNKEIFLDAYNANPSSMKVALSGFKESILEKNIALGDACVILGDMNELGEKTPDYHEDVGIFVKSLGFSQVFFVGRFADHYLKGFPGGHKKNSVKEFREEFLNNYLEKYSIHFIKGSRSLQLESLFDIN